MIVSRFVIFASAIAIATGIPSVAPLHPSLSRQYELFKDGIGKEKLILDKTSTTGEEKYEHDSRVLQVGDKKTYGEKSLYGRHIEKSRAASSASSEAFSKSRGSADLSKGLKSTSKSLSRSEASAASKSSKIGSVSASAAESKASSISKSIRSQPDSEDCTEQPTIIEKSKSQSASVSRSKAIAGSETSKSKSVSKSDAAAASKTSVVTHERKTIESSSYGKKHGKKSVSDDDCDEEVPRSDKSHKKRKYRVSKSKKIYKQRKEVSLKPDEDCEEENYENVRQAGYSKSRKSHGSHSGRKLEKRRYVRLDSKKRIEADDEECDDDSQQPKLKTGVVSKMHKLTHGGHSQILGASKDVLSMGQGLLASKKSKGKRLLSDGTGAASSGLRLITDLTSGGEKSLTGEHSKVKRLALMDHFYGEEPVREYESRSYRREYSSGSRGYRSKGKLGGHKAISGSLSKLGSLKSGFESQGQNLLSGGLSKVHGLKSGLESKGQEALTGHLSKVHGLKSGLKSKGRKVLSEGLSKVHEVKSVVESTGGKLVSDGLSKVHGLKSGISSKSHKLLTGGVSKVKGLHSKVGSMKRHHYSSGTSKLHKKAISGGISKNIRMTAEVPKLHGLIPGGGKKKHAAPCAGGYRSVGSKTGESCEENQ